MGRCVSSGPGIEFRPPSFRDPTPTRYYRTHMHPPSTSSRDPDIRDPDRSVEVRFLPGSPNGLWVSSFLSVCPVSMSTFRVRVESIGSGEVKEGSLSPKFGGR